MQQPEQAPIHRRINNEFRAMPRVPFDFTEEQLDHAANCIDLPVERVLTRLDEMNNEVAALSFFVSETWRLMVDAKQQRPCTDQFSIHTAPIMRRITELARDASSLLAGLRIDAELDSYDALQLPDA